MLAALQALSNDLRDYGGAVRTVAQPLDELTFYRDFVAGSLPCVINGLIDDWRAPSSWTPTYLSEKLENCEVAPLRLFTTQHFSGTYDSFTRHTARPEDLQQIPVTATPDGKADAVRRLPGSTQSVFALPAEGRLKAADVFDHISSSRPGNGNVLYVQQQNDCLRQDFAPLLGDVGDARLGWAERVFGGPPEAVNLWIGGAQSVTTFHKDPYENVFAVVAGCKTFTLLPPADVYRLAMREYPVARYVAAADDLRSCGLELRRTDAQDTVRWCPIDPRDPAIEKQYPRFSDPALPTPLKVIVRAGQVLYLPSLWHHYVEQAVGPHGLCIAVNMWYDMAVDTKFAHYSAVERLSTLVDQQ